MNTLQNIIRNIYHRSKRPLPQMIRKSWLTTQESTESPVTEEVIQSLLKQKFPNSKSIIVQDTSGGCGAMFNVYIESSDFKGLSTVNQHKAVYAALQEQIKQIHGLHVETKRVD